MDSMSNSPLLSKLIIVPYWISRALIRNKLNYIDLLDYSRVRSILSLDDMVDFLVCNAANEMSVHNEGSDGITPILAQWEASVDFTPALSAYLTKLVLNATDSLNRVEARLQLSESDGTGMACLPAAMPYYTVTIGSDRNIYIILERGFVNARATAVAFLSAFYSDVVKALYQLHPVHTVSACYTVFKKYVERL
jgi:hypothetical protein